MPGCARAVDPAPRCRLLARDDAARFRDFRLAGLKESPLAFGSSFEDERDLPLAHFAGRVTPTATSWLLGAFASADELAGCLGWYRDTGRKTAHKGHLWGMYVAPAWRGRGIARGLLAEALARCAREPGLVQVELLVSVDNVPAANLYAAAGFRRAAVLPRSLLLGGRFVDDLLMVLDVADIRPA